VIKHLWKSILLTKNKRASQYSVRINLGVQSCLLLIKTFWFRKTSLLGSRWKEALISVGWRKKHRLRILIVCKEDWTMWWLMMRLSITSSWETSLWIWVMEMIWLVWCNRRRMWWMGLAYKGKYLKKYIKFTEII
jgi:hypothetical protein